MLLTVQSFPPVPSLNLGPDLSPWHSTPLNPQLTPSNCLAVQPTPWRKLSAQLGTSFFQCILKFMSQLQNDNAQRRDAQRGRKKVCGAHLRYELGPKCCGKCCTPRCDAGPFARLWGDSGLNCDCWLGPSAACLATIRFGWQIATLTGGAPRKFLSAWCSIKDARFGNRKR